MLSKEDLSAIDNLMDKKLNPIKEDVSKTRTGINVIISLFDREYVDLRKRVEIIEKHLQLSQNI